MFITCYLQLHPLGFFPCIDFLKRHEGVWSPRVAGFILVFVARHRVNCKCNRMATVSLHIRLMINDVISRNNQQIESPYVNTNIKKNYKATKSPFPEGEKGEKSQSAKSGKKLRLRWGQTYKAIREIESWWWTESSFYKAINKLVKWVNSINWPSFKRNQPSKKSVVKWRWKNLEFCRLDRHNESEIVVPISDVLGLGAAR
jgi:hypothetical protein